MSTDLRTVAGAQAARELCMHPVDWNAARYPARAIGQLKADGVRALFLGEHVFTREGLPLDCAAHCLPGLRTLQTTYRMPMMFDCEYVAEDGFHATLSDLRRGKGEGVCWVHDAVPLIEWERDRSVEPTSSRLRALAGHFASVAVTEFVGMLRTWPLHSLPDAEHMAIAMWNAGYEGIVVKDAAAPYARRRSHDWMRLKQTVTADMPIIDVLEKGGAFAGIIVRTDVGPVTFRAPVEGSEQLMALRSSGAFPLVEISYQRTTGKRRAARGPRLLRIRWDRMGEQA